MSSAEPWSTSDAADHIRRIAANASLRITYSQHAREQIAKRDLVIGDVLYVLKHGFVYSAPTAATQPKLWKYPIETRTPNSGNRVVRVIAIPDLAQFWIKVVTVMWVDE